MGVLRGCVGRAGRCSGAALATLVRSNPVMHAATSAVQCARLCLHVSSGSGPGVSALQGQLGAACDPNWYTHIYLQAMYEQQAAAVEAATADLERQRLANESLRERAAALEK